MRFAKGAALMGILFLALGALVLFMEGKAGPVDQPPLEKFPTWGDDRLVHPGRLTAYAGNGYSSDYNFHGGDIYVGVVGYAGADPDTCFLYKSTNNGDTWTLNSYWVDAHYDISNPQVVCGQMVSYYLFLFGRSEEENGNILVNRCELPNCSSWGQYTISGNSRGIKNFVVTRDQGGYYNLHLAYSSDSCDVYYMRSSNYGQTWTTYDTLDGDMPHLAVGGADGSEDIFLVWRLDGEKGALYAADSHGKVKKNKELLDDKWYLTADMPTADTAYCVYQDHKGGAILVGTGNSGDVYRSEDGGDTWTLTGDLDGAECVYDMAGETERSYIFAATGAPARIFRCSGDCDTWTEKLQVSGKDAFVCLAFDSTYGNDGCFYAATDEGDVYWGRTGGENWDERTDPPGLDRIYDIIATNTGAVLTAGYNDDSPWKTPLFRSTDQGDSWDPVSDSLYVYRCLLQALDGIVYTIGVNMSLQRRLLKSTNDGVDWTYLPTPPILPRFIYQGSDSTLYIGTGNDNTYRSTDGGNSWQQFYGCTHVMGLIQSKPQIALKRSLAPSYGVAWDTAHIMSNWLSDVSDPKVAAGQGTSDYITWVVYSQKEESGDWDLRFGESVGGSQGGMWSKDNELDVWAGEKQLAALKVLKRGAAEPMHVAYISDADGTNKVYWEELTPEDAWNMDVSTCIGDLKASTTHGPEITFLQNTEGPGVFYCQLFGIPIERTMNLRFDGHHLSGVVEEDGGESRISDFSLSQNYPNPFNPVTRIQFTPYSSQTPIPTTLRIYNIQGELVKTLVDEPKESGNYQVIWDGKNESGAHVASGIYLCKLKVGDQAQTKKMVLLK